MNGAVNGIRILLSLLTQINIIRGGDLMKDCILLSILFFVLIGCAIVISFQGIRLFKDLNYLIHRKDLLFPFFS